MEPDDEEIQAHGESLKSDIAAICANLADISDNLGVMAERVACLPTKRFWILATTIQIALLSGIILFSEELKALAGL